MKLNPEQWYQARREPIDPRYGKALCPCGWGGSFFEHLHGGFGVRCSACGREVCELGWGWEEARDAWNKAVRDELLSRDLSHTGLKLVEVDDG